MRLHCIVLGVTVVIFAGLAAGCNKSESASAASSTGSPPASSAAPPPVETIARVHWLGLKRLAREKNAAAFMRIWNLPESARLETEVIDKLAQAPWRLLGRPSSLAPRTSPNSTLLRPLLKDLLQEESFLEIREARNQPGELAFAIRLDDAQAAVWQTNLAKVLDSLTGIPPETGTRRPYAWTLKKHHVPNLIELARTNGWTIVGAAQDHNGLMDELLARLHSQSAPFAARTTNYWLEASFDLKRISDALGLGWELPKNLPSLACTAIGDGTNVLTHAELSFPQRLELPMAPWSIPTNLIDKTLVSFTAIRGIRPWIESLRAWKDLDIGPAPDQICFWASSGFKMQTYFTAPLPRAGNAVHKFAGLVLQRLGPWFVRHPQAEFVRSTRFNGLEWKGLPFMTPFLRSIKADNNDFVYGGCFPNPVSEPISGKLIYGVLDRPNLVYHDRELTGIRIEEWLYMGQFFRFVSDRHQLPFKSAGLLWLKALEPRLRESVTEIVRTGPGKLSFKRKSTIGFTAIELHLLADWVESPEFPIGLHTFSATSRPGHGEHPSPR